MNIQETYLLHEVQQRKKESAFRSAEPYKWKDKRKRKELQIDHYLDAFVETVRNNAVTIVQAETGVGKTTRLGQALHDSQVAKKIYHTQPRRAAVRWNGSRIAEEMGVERGDKVGWRLSRGESQQSNKTDMLLMVDQSLVNQIRKDKKLPAGVIIIDEAHERSISTDLLLALVKQYLPDSPETKIVITSATIDTQKFAHYFANSPILDVINQQNFPVEVKPITLGHGEHHNSGAQRGAEIAIQAFFKDKLSTEYEPNTQLDWQTGLPIDKDFQPKKKDVIERGSLLVLLPGKEDVSDVARSLRTYRDSLPDELKEGKQIEIITCHSEVSAAEQDEVIKPIPHNTLRIVVGTEVIRSSVTVPETIGVIDSLQVKRKYVDAHGVSHLKKITVSGAEADQGKGRGGRTRTSFYWPVSYQNEYENITKRTSREYWPVPAIIREPLTSVILQIAANDLSIRTLDLLDKPEEGKINVAIERLQNLGALDTDENITALGRKLIEFPIDPEKAVTLITAGKLEVLPEAIIATAVLETENIFFVPKFDAESALVTYKYLEAMVLGHEITDLQRSWIIQTPPKGMSFDEYYCYIDFNEFVSPEWDIESVTQSFAAYIRRDETTENKVKISLNYFSKIRTLFLSTLTLEEKKSCIEEWAKNFAYKSGDYYQVNLKKTETSKTEWRPRELAAKMWRSFAEGTSSDFYASIQAYRLFQQEKSRLAQLSRQTRIELNAWLESLDFDPQHEDKKSAEYQKYQDFRYRLRYLKDSALMDWCRAHSLNHKRMILVENLVRDIADEINNSQLKLDGKPHEIREFSSDNITKAIISGNVDAVLRRDSLGYAGRKGKGILVGNNSAAYNIDHSPEYIIVGGVRKAQDKRSKEKHNLYAEQVAPVDPAWIIEMVPQLCADHIQTNSAKYDSATGQVLGVSEVVYQGVVLQEREDTPVRSELATNVLIDKIMEGSLEHPVIIQNYIIQRKIHDLLLRSTESRGLYTKNPEDTFLATLKQWYQKKLAGVFTLEQINNTDISLKDAVVSELLGFDFIQFEQEVEQKWPSTIPLMGKKIPISYARGNSRSNVNNAIIKLALQDFKPLKYDDLPSLPNTVFHVYVNYPNGGNTYTEINSAEKASQLNDAVEVQRQDQAWREFVKNKKIGGTDDYPEWEKVKIEYFEPLPPLSDNTAVWDEQTEQVAYKAYAMGSSFTGDPNKHNLVLIWYRSKREADISTATAIESMAKKELQQYEQVHARKLIDIATTQQIQIVGLFDLMLSVGLSYYGFDREEQQSYGNQSISSKLSYVRNYLYNDNPGEALLILEKLQRRLQDAVDYFRTVGREQKLRDAHIEKMVIPEKPGGDSFDIVLFILRTKEGKILLTSKTENSRKAPDYLIQAEGAQILSEEKSKELSGLIQASNPLDMLSAPRWIEVPNGSKLEVQRKENNQYVPEVYTHAIDFIPEKPGLYAYWAKPREFFTGIGQNESPYELQATCYRVDGNQYIAVSWYEYAQYYLKKRADEYINLWRDEERQRKRKEITYDAWLTYTRLQKVGVTWINEDELVKPPEEWKEAMLNYSVDNFLQTAFQGNMAFAFEKLRDQFTGQRKNRQARNQVPVARAERPPVVPYFTTADSTSYQEPDIAPSQPRTVSELRAIYINKQASIPFEELTNSIDSKDKKIQMAALAELLYRISLERESDIDALATIFSDKAKTEVQRKGFLSTLKDVEKFVQKAVSEARVSYNQNNVPQSTLDKIEKYYESVKTFVPAFEITYGAFMKHELTGMAREDSSIDVVSLQAQFFIYIKNMNMEALQDQGILDEVIENFHEFYTFA